MIEALFLVIGNQKIIKNALALHSSTVRHMNVAFIEKTFRECNAPVTHLANYLEDFSWDASLALPHNVSSTYS